MNIQGAIDLLKAHEPPEGYYLAFSGGKDSVVIKELARISGVRFDAWYNLTTIDPPELIRFIKEYHADVRWNKSRFGNMMHRVATAPKIPPTRNGRWCCEEYKEYGGKGRMKIMGVRAAESPRRKILWSEVSQDKDGSVVICPIVSWSNDDIWRFIRSCGLPYCSLYDEGWSRLGCVGCPLQSKKGQDREFLRWPLYERNWRRAIILNWERWKDVPNTRTGQPRYHAKFRTGEDFWQWWRTAKAPDYIRGDCSSESLWTNIPGITEEI